MTKRCVVAGCSNTCYDGVPVHRWPTNNKLKSKWDRFVKMKRADWRGGGSWSVVCGSHFKPEDYKNFGIWKAGFISKLTLKSDAFPTVYVTPVERTLPTTSRATARVEVNRELHFCTPLSSCKMQAGVCLRPDTETTLPELTEQHRICLKEEELSGLESVHMAESETEFAAQGLSTLEPESVSAHCRVSNAYHTDTSLIKTETDLGSAHTEELKAESLNSSELGYATHLHPDQIKTETDDGGYLKAEHISHLQDIKCVVLKYEDMKCESSQSFLGHLVNTDKNGAAFDHEIKTEPCQCAGKSNETVHAGEKPHKHARCGKCFFYLSHLNAHQRIHTDKPYKCPYCDKCFKRESHLNSHQKIHTDDKPHKCTQCGKCFLYRSHLNSHQRTHTGGILKYTQ